MPVESYPLTLEKPLKMSNVTYLWCNDGWCYIPEINIRRKYSTSDNNSELNIIEQNWTGVIPVCEYSEMVEISLYSDSPQIWKEKIEDFSELYVESKEIQKVNKKSRAHQQPLQG